MMLSELEKLEAIEFRFFIEFYVNFTSRLCALINTQLLTHIKITIMIKIKTSKQLTSTSLDRVRSVTLLHLVVFQPATHIIHRLGWARKGNPCVIFDRHPSKLYPCCIEAVSRLYPCSTMLRFNVRCKRDKEVGSDFFSSSSGIFR